MPHRSLQLPARRSRWARPSAHPGVRLRRHPPSDNPTPRRRISANHVRNAFSRCEPQNSLLDLINTAHSPRLTANRSRAQLVVRAWPSSPRVSVIRSLRRGRALLASPVRYHNDVQQFNRITMDPDIMGGKPCIRGMRVTVGTIVEALSAGRTTEQLLADFPYLEEADIRDALAFAARLAQGHEIRLAS